MVSFISSLVVALAFLVAIPVVIFCVEVLAAIGLPERNSLAPASGVRPRVAILVPAHNESTGLLPTLADVKAQMRVSDQLLVVADNCTDDTAAVALAAGADVINREEPNRRGKGYALAWGIRHLSANPPDVVIIIDADCRLADTVIDQLAAACAFSHRPVQALYVMTSPDDSPINSRVAEFAWCVRNRVRPLGLRALGLPCQLMGTGMAFPWNVIRTADLATGSIVEDLKLGIDLAMAGYPPVFCPTACVTSNFPSSVRGAQTQRRRWEYGHIGIILTVAPRAILAAITRANGALLVLSLDAGVPPLSLLGMLVLGTVGVTGLATILGLSSTALLISSASLAGFTGGVVLSWLKYGRNIIPTGSIMLIGSYIIGKIPIYRQILSRKPGSQWIRTDRK